MNAVDIQRLTKRYSDMTAVDALSLTIEEGELFALLGVNGAGKSTVIKMLSGLTPPTDGRRAFNGIQHPGESLTRSSVHQCFSAGNRCRAEAVSAGEFGAYRGAPRRRWEVGA